MFQGVLSCLLILMGQETVAHNHDTAPNVLSLANLLKDAGANNNCDILLLPEDKESCLGQGHPCYLEFEVEDLIQAEVSNNIIRCCYLSGLASLEYFFRLTGL